MKIFLTGADGFIGSHMTKRLSPNHEIIKMTADLGPAGAFIDYDDSQRVLSLKTSDLEPFIGRHNLTFTLTDSENDSNQVQLVIEVKENEQTEEQDQPEDNVEEDLAT